MPSHTHVAPHLAVPFRLDGDRFATVEDGSDDEVRQNVAVLVGTRVGERLVVPAFGISDPTFTTTDDESEIVRTVAEFEERAVLDIDIVNDGSTRTVTVNVRQTEG